MKNRWDGRGRRRGYVVVRLLHPRRRDGLRGRCTLWLGPLRARRGRGGGRTAAVSVAVSVDVAVQAGGQPLTQCSSCCHAFFSPVAVERSAGASPAVGERPAAQLPRPPAKNARQ